MKSKFHILTIAILLTLTLNGKGQNNTANNNVSTRGAKLLWQIQGTDTVYLAYLHDLWVFPRTTFKNKKQEKFFWRTVNDVKRTLPYAKLLAQELNTVNTKILSIESEKERKKVLNEYEKTLFKKHEKELKKMSISQGRMLMKLIDRECDRTSYDLIKVYKGNTSAFLWQGVAKVFGSNLKSEYNEKEDDKQLERVIKLVEAGQL
jgi:hypothetical protein